MAAKPIDPKVKPSTKAKPLAGRSAARVDSGDLTVLVEPVEPLRPSFPAGGVPPGDAKTQVVTPAMLLALRENARRPDTGSSEETAVTVLGGASLVENVRSQLAQSHALMEHTLQDSADTFAPESNPSAAPYEPEAARGTLSDPVMAAILEPGAQAKDQAAPEEDVWGVLHTHVDRPKGRASLTDAVTRAMDPGTRPGNALEREDTVPPLGPAVVKPGMIVPPLRTHRVAQAAQGKLLLAVPDGAKVTVEKRDAGAGSVLLLGVDPQQRVAVEVHLGGCAPWKTMVSLGGKLTGQVRVELRRLV